MANDFGKYEVIAEIGRGGMGVIYKAQDPRLDRFVAIKQLLLDAVPQDKREEYKERFRREAILAAGLNHPNLVSIYDVSIADSVNDVSYYVMELLEGHSFRAELELRPQNRLTAEEFLPLLKQIGEGLSAAHDNNLVHRDIKPDNIFVLANKRIKLTDFGIARASGQENSNLTKPGVMLGTLSYVSPEQLQDARAVDNRADVYSLGVVMYEALSGQLPFAGEGLTSTMMAIVSREAEPLHEVHRDISRNVASVVAKALRKNAEDRYPSAMDLVQDFERALNAGNSAAISGGQLRISGSQKSGGGFSPGLPLDEPSGSGKSAGAKPWGANRVKEAGTIFGGEHDDGGKLAKFISTIGKPGEERGCFLECGVVVALNGKIIIGDTIARKFQVFGRDGRHLADLQTQPQIKNSKTGGGAFSKPSSIAIDAAGRSFATDSGDRYVRVFDVQGKFAKEFFTSGGKDGGLNGIICDTNANLYISDPDNGCVHVINADNGQWLRKVSSKGKTDGHLQLPSGLALDRSGQLYVVDYATSRVSVFSKARIFQRAFGGKGAGDGEFNVPRGIAIDRFDRVFIADSLNHRVQVFDINGAYVGHFGGRGAEPGKFVGPSDLSIDPQNNCLYVADRGNSRVQVFELIEG